MKLDIDMNDPNEPFREQYLNAIRGRMPEFDDICDQLAATMQCSTWYAQNSVVQMIDPPVIEEIKRKVLPNPMTEPENQNRHERRKQAVLRR